MLENDNIVDRLQEFMNVVSNAKIKAALGMTEMPVRAVDGLRATIKSFAK